MRTDRYRQYRDMIGSRFYEGRCPGEIIKTSDTGDKHLHGDAVTRIETSEGRTIYYKPRDCRSSELLGDINEVLFGIRMVPEQVMGDGFAFQKEVVRKIPETSDERSRYYHALGKITAVFYALGSSDMHKDNILCSTDGPVVVDTETVLCPKAKGVGGTGEFSVDYGEIFPDYKISVGECMVLPRFFALMQMSPMIPNEDCRPEGYVDVFIDGFVEGYERICNMNTEVNAILDRFSDIPIRYLLRSTQSYAVKIWRYQNAKSEEDRAKVIQSLEKGLSKTDIDHWRAVLDWEAKCIREGDIPYFGLISGGRALMGDIGRPPLISDYLEESPVDYAKWRIGRMGPEDMKVQIAYIRASLKHIDGWEKKTETEEAEVSVLSVEDAVSEVNIALEKLWDERIALSDGCCLWHTPLINGKVGCLFGIGEGFSGAALFAKACADSPLITGEYLKTAKELTRACYNNMALFAEYLLRDYPTPPEERVISRRFNGGFDLKDGLKGLLWALDTLRDTDPERTDKILDGFRSWCIGYDRETIFDELLSGLNDGDITDCIDGGGAGTALKILLTNDSDHIEDAGIILSKISSIREQIGCYRVYVNGRHQYFLPAFLRGSTGIAYTMLRYAEASSDNCRAK